MPAKFLSIVFGATILLSATSISAQTIDLASSKQLIGEAPGHPQRTNGLPMSMAISPDGRYVVTVDAGYGTYESQYEQSLTILDREGGSVADFLTRGHQSGRNRRCIRDLLSAGMEGMFTRAWLR